MYALGAFSLECKKFMNIFQNHADNFIDINVFLLFLKDM